MSSPRVVIVHHHRSFSPMDLLSELDGVVDPVWLLSDGEATGEATRRLLGRRGAVVDASGLTVDETAAALRGYHPQGIVTFVDDQLVATAELASRLGLRFHTPEVARTLTDKGRQRAVLAAAGVAGPAFWTLEPGASSRERAEFGRSIRYPAVLKPARGSGSRGIVRVDGQPELNMSVEGDPAAPGWVAEEYLPGLADVEPWMASYVSVESVVYAGRARHVALTGRFPLVPPFRESGNFIPALLPDPASRAVVALVERALRALDVVDAVVHTEVMLTAEGPRIIEVNGRLGGRPPFVLRSVSDVNLFAVACLACAGVETPLPEPAGCRGVGFWLMLHPPMSAVRLSGIDGLEECAALEGVESVALHVNAGEAVDWRLGTEARVVTIRGVSSDHARLARTVDLIRATVTMRFEPTGD